MLPLLKQIRFTALFPLLKQIHLSTFVFRNGIIDHRDRNRLDMRNQLKKIGSQIEQLENVTWLGILPFCPNAKTIYFSDQFKEYIGPNDIPNSVKTIKLGTRYTQHVSFLNLPSVEKLYYGHWQPPCDKSCFTCPIDLPVCPTYYESTIECICYIDYEAKGYTKDEITGGYIPPKTD